MIYNKDSSAIAISSNGYKITYGTLWNKIRSLSERVETVSVNRIALFSENSAEWIYAFYAALLRGETVVPIDALSQIDDLAYILADSNPEVIFVSPSLEDTLNKALGENSFREVIVLEPETKSLESKSKISSEITESPKPINISPREDQPIVIIYTSGTTANPKGVILSWENILNNIHGVTIDAPIFQFRSRTALLLPLHHIFSLLGAMLTPIYTGGEIALSPSLNPSDIQETLVNNKVNIIIGVPRFYELMYKGIKAKMET